MARPAAPPGSSTPRGQTGGLMSDKVKGQDLLDKLRGTQTYKRDSALEVIKFGRTFLDLLQATNAQRGICQQKEIEQFCEQFIKDFNFNIASDVEVRDWSKLVQVISKQRRLLPLIFKVLMGHVVRRFHDLSEYSTFGHTRQIKLIYSGVPGNDKVTEENSRSIQVQSLDKIRQGCIGIITKAALDTPLSPASREYQFLMAVLAHHPRAAEKFRRFKHLTICFSRELKCRVITINYENGLVDDISFVKCIQNIRDPNVERVRNILINEIHKFMADRGQTDMFCKTIAETLPPPEFQQDKGRILRAKEVTNEVVNSVKIILGVMKRFGLTIKSRKQKAKQYLMVSAFAEFQKFRRLQEILFAYLHKLEAELVADDGDSSSSLTQEQVDDETGFSAWLKSQCQFLEKKIIEEGIDPERAERLRTSMLERIDALRLKYVNEKVEAEASPVKHKLDEVFTCVFNFYHSELDICREHEIAKAVFEKDFKRLVTLPVLESESLTNAADQTPSGSPLLSPASSPEQLPEPDDPASDVGSTLGGLLLSDDGAGSDDVRSVMSFASRGAVTADGARLANGNVSCIAVLASSILDEFDKNVLEAEDSPCLPLLIFGLVNTNFGLMNRLLLERLVLKPELDHRRRARIIGLLVGYACRAQQLPVSYVQQIAHSLAEELLLRLGDTSASASHLQPLLFSGVLEVLASRWDSLQEEIETSFLVRLLLILTRAYEMRPSIIMETAKEVRLRFAQRIGRFDLAHHDQYERFLSALSESCPEGLQKWPKRPFEMLDLRMFKSSVGREGQYNDISSTRLVLPDVDMDKRLRIGNTDAPSIWSDILRASESAPLSHHNETKKRSLVKLAPATDSRCIATDGELIPSSKENKRPRVATDWASKAEPVSTEMDNEALQTTGKSTCGKLAVPKQLNTAAHSMNAASRESSLVVASTADTQTFSKPASKSCSEAPSSQGEREPAPVVAAVEEVSVQTLQGVKEPPEQRLAPEDIKKGFALHDSEASETDSTTSDLPLHGIEERVSKTLKARDEDAPACVTSAKESFSPVSPRLSDSDVITSPTEALEIIETDCPESAARPLKAQIQQLGSCGSQGLTSDDDSQVLGRHVESRQLESTPMPVLPQRMKRMTPDAESPREISPETKSIDSDLCSSRTLNPNLHETVTHLQVKDLRDQLANGEIGNERSSLSRHLRNSSIENSPVIGGTQYLQSADLLTPKSIRKATNTMQVSTGDCLPPAGRMWHGTSCDCACAKISETLVAHLISTNEQLIAQLFRRKSKRRRLA